MSARPSELVPVPIRAPTARFVTASALLAASTLAAVSLAVAVVARAQDGGRPPVVGGDRSAALDTDSQRSDGGTLALEGGVAPGGGREMEPGAPAFDGGSGGTGALVGDGGVGADETRSMVSTDAGLEQSGVLLGPGAGARLGGPNTAPASPRPRLSLLSAESDGGRVIRTLLGLVALLALAWIGAHPRVQRLEERLGISQVVTSGLPFVVLGLIARAPGIDVLSEDVLIALTPLLQFGLGWIGFHTGFQFEGAAMDEVPRGTSSVVILLTGASFAMIALSCGLLLWALGFGPIRSTLARDAAIIGLAGALSAPTIGRIAGARISQRALELAHTIGVLDDVVGVVALAMLFAWLHPVGSSWELPGVGWLFVTFGMAATLGLMMFAVLRGVDSAAESTTLLLGSVCFTAGMAGYFAIPPLVVCFFAGMLLKNLPGGDKPRLAIAFARLERPIYLVFLVVVGALWKIDDWRGWAMLPVFVLARVLGRWLGLRIARRLPADSRHPGLDEVDDPDLVAPPMGALALAFVVTARTLYESSAIQAIVTTVIGGAVATEIIVQIAVRRSGRRSSMLGTVAATKRSGAIQDPGAGTAPAAPVASMFSEAPPPGEPPDDAS